ncbi:MAG: dihydroorotase [Burkholderiaceae bacterium]|jgi:dihydroorotase|nr:dihydroorotase [Burkholderiaceae bacterium]
MTSTTTIPAHHIEITRPDDWHLHLRDGDALKAVAAHSAAQFGRAMIMPNLRPPVVTTGQAVEYRQRILAALPATSEFVPLMTLYLTDHTPPDEIRRARESGIVFGVKLYPAGATTHSDAGVTDLAKCMKTLEAMQHHGLPLLMHGEVTDPAVDIFDREAVFIDRVLRPLRKSLPALKIVFEHITTKEAVQYVKEAEGETGATITAHHLLFNRNALFTGGLCPHYYCLPVLKREENRQALVKAAISGNPRFFAGTDSAPHARGLKENACGCAGCYTALHAVELYAKVFDDNQALPNLEAFLSLNGAAFHGLPHNSGKITLARQDWHIPEALPFGEESVVPLMAGETLPWRKV